MKDELIHHTAEIFSTLQIPECFEVFECEKDLMPQWTSQLTLTHEFLIYCKELDVPQTEKLQNFLGKKLYRFDDYIYWFDGTQIMEPTLSESMTLAITENAVEENIACLKTNTILPQWLDRLIFNQLGAEYSPDFQRFDYNLDLTQEENRKYLGTYFPRSYAESFCIFDNIFQNTVYQKIIRHKTVLNILTVGCGTGGDLTGLLTIIEKYCTEDITLNIWAIDGNKIALDILKKIVNQFLGNVGKKIVLNLIQSVFDASKGGYILENEIEEREYDFILSFKMITELISVAKGAADNSYFAFLKTFVPLLSNDGLCVLLDVTTKQEHNNTYNPILMNRQANKALMELRKHQTLLPLPCSLYEGSCNSDCFTQQQFAVSHSKRRNDISKVAYRIIASTNLVSQLAAPDVTVRYLIGKDNTCCFTDGNTPKADSFLL